MERGGVLVYFDGSRKAERALADAVEVARRSAARLTVLTLAPVEKPSRCCNLHTTMWNREMEQMAARDAQRARALLPGDVAVDFAVRAGRPGDVVRLARDVGALVLVRPRRHRRTPAVVALG